MKKILIPEENKTDVPSALRGIEVIPVAQVQDVIRLVCRQPMDYPGERS